MAAKFAFNVVTNQVFSVFRVEYDVSVNFGQGLWHRNKICQDYAPSGLYLYWVAFCIVLCTMLLMLPRWGKKCLNLSLRIKPFPEFSYVRLHLV